MSQLRITAACSLLGISPSTLRHWDRRYDGALSTRSPGGHRYFDRELVLGLKDALGEGLSGRAAVLRALEFKDAGHSSGHDELFRRVNVIARRMAGMSQALEDLTAEVRSLRSEREERALRSVA